MGTSESAAWSESRVVPLEERGGSVERGALRREIVCSPLGKGLYCKHRYRDGNVGERSVRVRSEDREDREEDITWRNNLEAVGASLRILLFA